FGASMVRGVGGATNPPDVAIANDGLLTYDSYRLTYGPGGTYSLTREGDGASIADPATIGLSINVPADAQAGEEYLIRPLAGSARDISVLISDPARFAAGQPLGAVVEVITADGNAVADGGNSGDGAITGVSQDFDANGAMMPFVLRFDGVGNPLVIDPATGYSIAPDADYDT